MKTCPHCTTVAPDDARMCLNCRKPFEQDPAPVSTAAAPVPPPPPVEGTVAGPGPAPAPEIHLTECPQCKEPWKPGAVLCLHCGYDARVGRGLPTVRGVEDVPQPPRPTALLLTVRTGLYLHACRVFVLILSIFLALILSGLALQVLAAAEPGQAPGAGDDNGTPYEATIILSLVVIALAVAQSVLGIVGSVLCLRVPPQSRARGWLVASLVLDVAAFLLSCGFVWPVWRVIGSFNLQAAAVIAPIALGDSGGSLPGLTAWILFMAFLRNLAFYLDRRDEAMQAVGIIVHGLIALFVIPLLVVPLTLFVVGMLGILALMGLPFGLLLMAGVALAWLVYGIWILSQMMGLLGVLREELLPKPSQPAAPRVEGAV